MIERYASIKPLEIIFENQSSHIKERKMAESQLKLYLDIIPTFDGNTFALNPFLAACDALHSKFGNTEADREFIIHAIISKLKGNAQIRICSRSELNTWPLVKAKLI